MQADAGVVPKSMFAHMGEIYRESGVLGFWRGASATVARPEAATAVTS